MPDDELKLYHFRMGVERHSHLPYIWRARCYCGKYFLGASEAAATMGLTSHIDEEEPFPIDMTPEDPSHGRND